MNQNHTVGPYEAQIRAEHLARQRRFFPDKGKLVQPWKRKPIPSPPPLKLDPKPARPKPKPQPRPQSTPPRQSYILPRRAIIDAAARALRDLFAIPDQRLVYMTTVQAVVARAFDIPLPMMRYNSHRSIYAEPRQVAMTICAVIWGKSSSEIGRAFQRDHSTVIHAWGKHRAMVERIAAELCA